MGVISDWLGSLDFQSFIYNLYNNGWFAFVFPFMLMYALIFTATEYVSIFKDKKPVRIVISLVLSLFAVSFNITGSGNIITFNYQDSLGYYMMALFPGVGVLSIFILALYIIFSIFGFDITIFLKDENGKIQKGPVLYTITGIGILFVLYYVFRGFGWYGFGYNGWWLSNIFSDPTLYILVLFILFFVWVSGGGENNGGSEKNEGITINQGGGHGGH